MKNYGGERIIYRGARRYIPCNSVQNSLMQLLPAPYHCTQSQGKNPKYP